MMVNNEERLLEAATEAYYRSLTDEERKQDRIWAINSSHQVVHRLEKEYIMKSFSPFIKPF